MACPPYARAGPGVGLTPHSKALPEGGKACGVFKSAVPDYAFLSKATCCCRSSTRLATRSSESSAMGKVLLM